MLVTLAAIKMAYFTFVLLAASLLVVTINAAPQNTKFGITIPEECRGNGFCSIRPEGYDEIEAQINKLFPQHLIVQDVVSRSSDEHIGTPSDDDDNCPSVTKFESVYTHNDKNGTKVDIIVQTKNFPQTIAKVTCDYSNKEHTNLKEGRMQCFERLGLSEFHTKFRCEQSYGTRTLMVYDPKLKLVSMKNYTIPVCCSCVKV